MRIGPLLLLLCAPFCMAQKAPPDPASAIQSEAARQYVNAENKMLEPAVKLIREGDYPAASKALIPVVEAYPKDLRVLFLAADTARIATDFEYAISLIQRCLETKDVYPGALHLGLIRIYADMNRWEDFNRERVLIQQMALNGDRGLSIDDGYIVEDHRSGTLHFETKEFPSTDPSLITRYRFFFVLSEIRGDSFVPSVDVEANPADAASFAQAYPAKAAAHIRGFALVSYPDAHTRRFLKFYPDGEPPYEDIHADVLAFAAGLKAAPKEPEMEKHRPEYRPK